MDIISVSKNMKEYKDYPFHQHKCWEILFSLKGSGEIRIDDDILPFHEGEVFVIPPNHPHCKKSETGYIDGCIFAENVQFDEHQVRVYEDSYNKTLFTLYEIAYYAQMRKAPYAKRVIDSIGDTIFHILQDLNSIKGGYNRDVDKFIHILMDNIPNPEFDISAAIAETGYNTDYFRMIFKSFTGITPVAYFTNLRIEQSKRMLKQYGNIRSVREIAEGVGFSDPYYFSRKFKQQTGMSPRDFIRLQEEMDHEMITRRIIGEGEDPEVQIRNQIRAESDKENKHNAGSPDAT